MAGARTAHQAKKTAGGRSSSFPRRLRTNTFALRGLLDWIPGVGRPRKAGLGDGVRRRGQDLRCGVHLIAVGRGWSTAGPRDMGRLASKSRRACVVASTWSS